MKEEMLKGYLISSLDNFIGHDLDSFITKMENHLADIKLEADIREGIEELISEGWIEYNQEGNNISTKTPEAVKKQKTLSDLK